MTPQEKPDTSDAAKKPKELGLLREVADDLDDFVMLPPDGRDGAIRVELNQAEDDLHQLYDKVSDLRQRLNLPPLILAPETEPPAYQSIFSQNIPSEILLEWKDSAERQSNDQSSLTLKLSRKVKQFSVLDSILVNGEKISRPPEGWVESAGLFMLYGGKNTFRVTIELDEDWSIAERSSMSAAVQSVGRHEIFYEVSTFGMKPGEAPVTKSREFRIRRSLK